MAPALALAAAGTIALRPLAMGRVLDNLLENARRHGAPPLRIETAREGRRLRISVLDRGPGVGAGEREALFHPFARGRAARAGTGSGLGLATARRIVRLHGGDLTLHPRPGGGLEARVVLPSDDGAGRAARRRSQR
jgi:two-component system osmolarity sensor histidine kinase EnvZ